MKKPKPPGVYHTDLDFDEYYRFKNALKVPLKSKPKPLKPKLVFCEKFELGCPYAQNLAIIGANKGKLCVGDSDQCWHWRNPKGKPRRGLLKPKQPESPEPEKPKFRIIEMKTNEIIFSTSIGIEKENPKD